MKTGRDTEKSSLKRRVCIDLRMLIFVLLIKSVCAQSLYVDRIGLAEGLSQNTITSIAQDPKGFMWFGTQDGLNRYDGYTFKKYGADPNNPHSMSGEIVWALLMDQEGVLWIGTLSGLNRYAAQTEQFVSYRHDPADALSLSDNSINALYEDSQGRIWIGTAAGLNQLNRQQQTFKRYMHDPNNSGSISNNGVNAIFEDSNRILWVATDQGVNRFNDQDETFTLVDEFSSVLKNAVVFALGEDRHGRLWMGTENDGLFVYDQPRQVVVRYTHNPADYASISSNKIRSMYKDSQDRFWVGTDGAGLNRLTDDGSQFIRYRHNPSDIHSLSDDAVYSIYEDVTGVIWIGTYTNGISKLNPYSFSLTLVSNKPTPEDPDPLKDSRAFVVSQRQETWVGSSYNGVKVTQANGVKRHYRHDPGNPRSLSNDKVYSLYESQDGTIWVGTAHGWINEYDPDTDSFIRYPVQPGDEGGLRHGEVRALAEDRSGVLWVGTDPGGVHAFDRNNKTFTHYHHNPDDPASISRNEIFGLYVDSRNFVWCATFGGGLNKLDSRTGLFTVYKHSSTENSISNDFPLAMYEDVNNNILWIAVYGSGIDRLDLSTGVFTNFSSKNGLADDSVYAVLQDENGMIWASHNKGMSRFDPAALKFDNYDERDGLQSNEFNGGAYYRARDGKLFFGGINGYNAFYPHQIKNNPHEPPVYITDFQLFNKPVGIDEEYNGRVLLHKSILDMNALTLSYKDYVFSLEFAALDYAYSSKNQYAYKMEGLEQNWNYVHNRRFVTYTTLPPGDYTFRVKASNNNGIWNEEGFALAITITPPFWQTWWFRLIAGILLAIIIYAVYRIRVKSIQSRNKMLESEVKLRTAELQKEKNHLEATLIELHETKDALVEAAHKAGMADTAIGVLHNVGNLLNSVNTSAGIIMDCVDRSVAKRFLKAQQMLVENKDKLIEYVSTDPKGGKILQYLVELGGPFTNENGLLRDNALRLKEKIDAIVEVIVAQQRYVQGHSLVEERCLKELVEDSLKLQSGSIGRHKIHIEKEYDDSVPNIKVQKAKLMQILVNLFKNAKESMDENTSAGNVLTIRISKDETHAYISIADTGIGIKKENLQSIFAQGFTTKHNGNGIGLHSCANYMTEMGGRLWAESEGEGHGAKFIMSFPLSHTREAQEPERNIA